jgi:hypothetical protein
MVEEKSANSANSYGIDSNWYADYGTTDHVIGELNKLVVRETYNRNDEIYTANGSGMHIKHIGHLVIHTPHRDLSLRDILHVLQSSKNFAFIHRIASYSSVFFELHPDFFFTRIRSRGKLFCKASLNEGSILFQVVLHPHPTANKFLVPQRLPPLDGMLD